MDRAAFLAPLGLQRLRLLDCLGGNSPKAPGYFDPSGDSEVFAAFAAYISDLSSRWATDSDPLFISLLAAGRLLTGEIAAANVIVEHLPTKAFKTDHGAGYCVIAPLQALKAALPLPAELTDIVHWIAGSPEQAALSEWLSEHTNTLRWSEAEGVYFLVE